MAKARKDERGRALRKGEVQRASDKRYMYTYTDPLGRRKFIYAQDLTTLREKEKQLIKDQLDGLDIYVAGKANLNDTFDRYMSTKCKLRETTRSNYIYIYDRFVRDTFGKKKIAEVKYSDVLQFYLHLLNVDDLSLGTLDSVKCRRLTIEGFPEKRRPVLSRAAKGKPVPPQYAPCEAEAGTSGIAQCRRQWTQATFP